MKNSYVMLLLLTVAVIALHNLKPEKVKYPTSKKELVVDTYFGNYIEDPYRWLEDDLSTETSNWVDSQNEVTFNYLKSIPYRDKLKSKLTSIWNYEKQTSPFTRGEYIYYYRNDGLQNQYVVYRKKDNLNSTEEVFLDPNKFSEDGTISLTGLYFSENGKLISYTISEGGSDWRKVFFLDTETKSLLSDSLINVKFSSLSWKSNEGIYYSTYDAPEGSELSSLNNNHKLYFHKLGTTQEKDQIIFGNKAEQKRRYAVSYTQLTLPTKA